MTRLAVTLTVLAWIAVLGTNAGWAEEHAENGEAMFQWVDVNGTGVHYLSTAIIHSTKPTNTGIIQRSTDIVELEGDLVGRLLYHPRSVFDFAAGTLVNRGNQVFSGTVLGSRPVLIHDDRFRFDVNLQTGETIGRVKLTDVIAGPNVRCFLTVVGTGQTAEGDSTVAYTGRCRIRGGRP